MVKNYTDKQLLDRVKTIPNFRSIPAGIWILGVRSSADLPNKFDDKFYFFKGEKFIKVITGTTHPGVSILKNHYKYNSKGAAVVMSDRWYYDLWVYGMHKGKMPALLQLGNKITVYRDGDKDNKAEEIGEVQTGFFGINFHTNTYDLNSKLTQTEINGWSAGCQVSNQVQTYFDLMKMCEKEKGKFTYCLIKEF
jgi:hypothetical protein